ncbi:MAG: hypothetical protein K1W28_01635 [Lachnospiraceae bacterium]
MDFKTEYFDIWMIAWNFHKKYAVMGEVNWEQAVEESAAIVEDYRGRPQQAFIKKLLAAALAELQRSEKNAQ